jgi:arylsulfate sulfotransferase
MEASTARQCQRCFDLSSRLVSLLALIALSACGGGGSSTSLSLSALSPASATSQGVPADVTAAATLPGPSPFISFVELYGKAIANVAGVEFTIAPKPGSVSKPVDVFYSIAALQARGYVYASESTIKMPVYGLYAGYANQVSLRLIFQDGTSHTVPVVITTAAYDDPSGIYSKPKINVARAAGSALGFDFFAMKSGLGSPVVVDTDAEIRWVIPTTHGSISTALQNDQFVIGDSANPIFRLLRLDGSETSVPVVAATFTDFHHNIDHGKTALLAEFDALVGGVKNVESNVAEINESGLILNHWDLGAIISAYMSSQGDDPTKFVRPGSDWFHNNATTYDPRDDSIIVSSRENFLIKLDYQTGNIIWIFGDPTKYWYTFPSLRAKAILLANGGLYPVGQHAVSITSQGYTMVFNDGDGSADQPAGQSPGITRTYSAVSAYTFDTASMTATDVFDFDYGQTIFSAVCSSAYEAQSQSILVDYAVAVGGTETRMVGLNAAHDVVFDFQYKTVPCETSWNAIPMPFDNMSIDF